MPVEIQQRPKCNLILHCGAQAVPRVEVARVTTPKATATWQPIPHVTLIETVEDALRAIGLRIGNQAHALSPDSNEYFGLTEIIGETSAQDYVNVVGIRNSHNKRFPAALVIGSSVVVCDNLAMLGSFKLSRKHTRFIERDLPQIVGRLVGQLSSVFHQQEQRIEAYKNFRLKDKTANDIVIRSFDNGAITGRMIPSVLKEYREPRHEVFREKSAWSLFNAFTEVLKGNLPELPKRTEVLHGLFDQQVKLSLAHLN